MLPKGLLKEYSRAISLMVKAMDMATVALAGWLAYYYRFDIASVSFFYSIAILIGVIATPIIFTFMDIYASIRGTSFVRHIMDLLQAVCLLAIFLAGISFFTKTGDVYSRTWFLIWMGAAFGLLVLVRCSLLLFFRFMRARGLNERRIAILGAGALGARLAEAVQQAMWTGFRIVTFIDDAAANKPNTIHHIPVIQTPDDLCDYLAKNQIDEIWLAIPFRSEARVKEILHTLRHHTITTRFVLDIFGLDLLNHSITDVAGFPVLNIRSTPMVGINRLVKALEDRFLAAIILVLISPVLLAVALAIKLTSKGPVLFKQKRLGWDGRVIEIYKFRTMVQHEEKEGVITQAKQDDKRITKVGKFLRRTSLDELPQFINVLQGRMSIVGPRPHALAHNEMYKDSVHTYMQRHRVKPGITGWAQVNGWRGETDTLDKMQKRVEYDLYYINNWSLAFDLKIIFLTIFRGFINRNAY
jgi:putative colanic acid biosynthesis UDP-glucose lipid carrier transferase